MQRIKNASNFAKRFGETLKRLMGKDGKYEAHLTVSIFFLSVVFFSYLSKRIARSNSDAQRRNRTDVFLAIYTLLPVIKAVFVLIFSLFLFVDHSHGNDLTPYALLAFWFSVYEFFFGFIEKCIPQICLFEMGMHYRLFLRLVNFKTIWNIIALLFNFYYYHGAMEHGFHSLFFILLSGSSMIGSLIGDCFLLICLEANVNPTIRARYRQDPQGIFFQ